MGAECLSRFRSVWCPEQNRIQLLSQTCNCDREETLQLALALQDFGLGFVRGLDRNLSIFRLGLRHQLRQRQDLSMAGQVWPLNQFFSCFVFVKKSLIYREILFSYVPPRNFLISVLTLEGIFELTRHPSRALDSPFVLLPALQRKKDIFRCVAKKVRRS